MGKHSRDECPVRDVIDDMFTASSPQIRLVVMLACLRLRRFTDAESMQRAADEAQIPAAVTAAIRKGEINALGALLGGGGQEEGWLLLRRYLIALFDIDEEDLEVIRVDHARLGDTSTELLTVAAEKTGGSDGAEEVDYAGPVLERAWRPTGPQHPAAPTAPAEADLRAVCTREDLHRLLDRLWRHSGRPSSRKMARRSEDIPERLKASGLHEPRSHSTLSALHKGSPDAKFSVENVLAFVRGCGDPRLLECWKEAFCRVAAGQATAEGTACDHGTE